MPVTLPVPIRRVSQQEFGEAAYEVWTVRQPFRFRVYIGRSSATRAAAIQRLALPASGIEGKGG
jgi:hypothetical protein